MVNLNLSCGKLVLLTCILGVALQSSEALAEIKSNRLSEAHGHESRAPLQPVDATSGMGYLRSLRVEQKRCLGQALQCPRKHLRCPSSFQQKPAKKKTHVVEKEKIAPK